MKHLGNPSPSAIRRTHRRIVFCVLLACASAVIHPLAVSVFFTAHASSSTRELLVYGEAGVTRADGSPGTVHQMRLTGNTLMMPSAGKTLVSTPILPRLQPELYLPGKTISQSRSLAIWTPRIADIDRPDRMLMHTLGYGWPFVSWAADYDTVAFQPVTAVPINGIPLHALEPVWVGHERLPRALPTRVIWIGLAGNMLAWTVSLFVVAQASLFLLRRTTPGRRGWRHDVCPECGYNVAGLDTCPECGEHRPSHRSARSLLRT